MTRRKIIAATYGGYARHGGGAFSGEHATKAHRSAAYFAGFVARQIVLRGIGVFILLVHSQAAAWSPSVFFTIFRQAFVLGLKPVNGEIPCMAEELFPSSFRCDCGKELHFSENTIKEMRAKSSKSPATLVADDSSHSITFTKGSATNIRCPKLGSVEIK